MIKKFNDFLNESTTYNDILTLDELKEKYPKMKFTMNPNKKFGDDAYFVRVDIEKQDGEMEYLGAYKGVVSKEEGLEFFNGTAKREYDKYY